MLVHLDLNNNLTCTRRIHVHIMRADRLVSIAIQYQYEYDIYHIHIIVNNIYLCNEKNCEILDMWMRAGWGTRRMLTYRCLLTLSSMTTSAPQKKSVTRLGPVSSPWAGTQTLDLSAA